MDQCGNVLDILVTDKRDAAAAKRFSRKLLKGRQYAPRVISSDKWVSYGAAKRELLPSVEQRRHKGLHNRAENSHQPSRQRERQLRHFKTAGYAQRFLSAFEFSRGFFRLNRHKSPAHDYHARRQQQFALWQQVTGAKIVDLSWAIRLARIHAALLKTRPLSFALLLCN